MPRIPPLNPRRLARALGNVCQSMPCAVARVLRRHGGVEGATSQEDEPKETPKSPPRPHPKQPEIRTERFRKWQSAMPAGGRRFSLWQPVPAQQQECLQGAHSSVFFCPVEEHARPRSRWLQAVTRQPLAVNRHLLGGYRPFCRSTTHSTRPLAANRRRSTSPRPSLGSPFNPLTSGRPAFVRFPPRNLPRHSPAQSPSSVQRPESSGIDSA
jgi:hypothetical protein